MDINDKVVGRFEWDDNIGDFDIRLPMVVIDGKKYSWNEFGRML